MSYLLHLVGSEVAARLGDAERVPPGGQRVQRDPLLGEGGDAFGEDAVVKDDEGMRDLATGVADRIDEVQLRATVGREVLDQQHAAALRKIALDRGVAAEALRLLAHVEHRQAERSEEHTSALQSLMRISYAVFCW